MVVKKIMRTGRTMAEDAVGGVIGVFGGGAAGHYVENTLTPGVTTSSNMTDKLLAWLANNGTKLGLYVVVKKVDAGGALTKHVPTGLAISAGIDTGIRLLNGGVNNVPLAVQGIQILGSMDSPERAAKQRRFNAMPSGFETATDTASFTEQRNAAKKAYSSMAVPGRHELQRHFGAMDGNSQNQIEKMFNCL